MSNPELDSELTLVNHTSHEEDAYPRENEGFLSPEDWHFNIGVDSISPKKYDNDQGDQWGNTISRWTIQMSDGIRLGMNFCEPRERYTDVAVLETPAWFTNLHGFNEHTQRALGSLGIPSILIGHVGQERKSAIREVAGLVLKPWESVREIRSISLARQAHNMITIYQHMAPSFNIDPNNVFLHGNSRGAMVQFPELAIARERGINVPFAMPVAPCFAEGFSKKTAQELRQAPRAELWNVGRLVLRNLFDMTGSGANTINISPKSVVFELAHADSLLNGDAGRFDDHIELTQNMLILAYKGDLAGQYEEWKQKFLDFPNVHVRDVPGTHLSIADKRTRAYVMRTFDQYSQQLREGQPATDLDHTHIRRRLSIVE